MTARTYTAAEMRDAFHRGRIIWGESRNEVLAVEEANRLWPDPAPEPPAMTVREELDPNNPLRRWRWTPQEGFMHLLSTANFWERPGSSWFHGFDGSAQLFALLADLAAFPMRLHDGRPCTLKGEAKP